MQLSKNKFDSKSIEQSLINENKFIVNLFSITGIPERKDFLDEYNDDEATSRSSGFSGQKTKTSRAKSLQELQQRLEAITSKKKLTYKEKLTKKGLKNRMKKKSKQDERNAKQKLVRAAKLTTKAEIKAEESEEKSNIIKPVFNSEDKMVFSKFDFANLGKKRNNKQDKDPKKLLKKLEEQKDKLLKLEETGETEKAIEIKEKTAWKNALAKAEGVKVKDDPTLLKKSVKKKEQMQRSSKKKWEKRMQGVQKAKDERQHKRKENIEKRKKDKKNKKLKTASKRGRVIPGF